MERLKVQVIGGKKEGLGPLSCKVPPTTMSDFFCTFFLISFSWVFSFMSFVSGVLGQ